MYKRRGIGNSGQETVSRLESGDERWNKPIRDTRDRGWETVLGVKRQLCLSFSSILNLQKIKEDVPPWRRIQKGFLKYFFATFRVIFKFVNKLKLNFGIGVLNQIGSTITPP